MKTFMVRFKENGAEHAQECEADSKDTVMRIFLKLKLQITSIMEM